MLKLSAWSFRKFVILSQARSGSTFLQRTLDSHPSIVCETELLGRPMLLNSYHFPFASLNNQTLTQYLDKKVWTIEEGKTNIRAKGFKIQYGQLGKQESPIHQYLSNERISIIHLIRQNVLNTVLSGKLNHFQDNELPKTKYPADWKVKIDANEIERALDRTSRFTKIVEGLFSNEMLVVYYEDLCQNREVTFAKIQDYLGVPHAPMTCNLVKQRVHTQREHIVNYDGLKEQLRDTPHSFMFED